MRPSSAKVHPFVSPPEARYFCSVVCWCLLVFVGVSFGEMSAAPKKRKLNYSPQERAIIVRAMTLYDRYLHGPESINTTQARRREILQLIADNVNALGSEARTPNEILKKINDLRRVVRGKLAKMATHARGTGGGPSTTLRLSAEERVVAQCLHRHQVEGVPGFDSVRTGKCVLFPIWCVACVGVEGNMCQVCGSSNM